MNATKTPEPEIAIEALADDEIDELFDEIGETPEPPPRKVKFERHVGSAYPLRVVYPDGSWLAVNRANEGLFSGDPRGRIVQLLARDQFHAVSPRQFIAEYKRVFGQTLRDRDEALTEEEAERAKR